MFQKGGILLYMPRQREKKMLNFKMILSISRMFLLNSIFFPDVFHLLLFLLTIETCRCGAFEGDDPCKPMRCSRDSPIIRFPFGLKGCNYPGFEMSCQGNHPLLLLQDSHQELVVTHISYTSRTLQLHSHDCPADLLFHLNLSASSFDYVYSHEIYFNYTFLRCSAGIAKCSEPDFGGYNEAYKMDCINDLEHDICLIDSDTPTGNVPVDCQFIKNVRVPMYFYDVSSHIYKPIIRERHLRLKWEMPKGCRGCDETKGWRCGFKNRNQSIETACFYQPPKGHSLKQAIIGCSLASFVVLMAAAVGIKMYYSWRLERKKDIENQIKVEKFLKEYESLKPTRYSYADVKRMTDQFKDKLGQGAYGKVYKGKLENGTPVAVKILHKLGEEAQDFVNEVATIGRIHHVNVVRLLGFCTENFKRALIYEFMPNESLERFIFPTQSKNPLLSWEKLQDIAIGIARGIEYLHLGCDQRILHFDIKPHNILLDQNFIPKISDFGLAKLCSKGQSVVSMTAARGTMGYIAPEVLSRNSGNVSYKSDIYSFGMLLLEMVGGRKNIDVTVENTSQVYFPEWVYNRLHRGEDLRLHTASTEDPVIAKKLSIVALWCIQWYPVDRPSMKSVVQMLEGSMEKLTMPPNPFVSSAPTNDEATDIQEMQGTKLSIIEEQEEGKELDIY